MKAIAVTGAKQLALTDIDPPPPPLPHEVQIAISHVAINHLDVWGWRGMAFVKRRLPLIAGVEATGTIVAVGDAVGGWRVGQHVAPFGGLVCGTCRYCRSGRENFCDAVTGIRGFHVDGFAAERVNHPARLMVAVPDGVPDVQAACVPVTFATVEHMLVDNARIEPGETVLVQSAGSGVGSAAISVAKALGCQVFTTAGSAAKCARALEIGADAAIEYKQMRVDAEIRRLTDGRGVDVVFEHVGADTWASSLLSLAKGGRLVTCGSTTGMSAPTNLFLLFQRQLRIFGSFGAPLDALARTLQRMAGGAVSATIDSELPLADFEMAVARLEGREVFGKIVLRL